ncbi:unnamed protein product [Fraxinus pennsylvanica]|uniref:DUF4408 domain-containing protein n=1 Tax=Fraxinus pennsylvanica TaxID=56036 RepID=A0AAD2A7P7_9LAMI|nr:unnamed protein product [Fraxinus pennsylvanica]
MWISFASFLTPTFLLFCVLNLTIVTIFITSALKKLQKLSDDQDNSPLQLIRVPSLLKRVKPINLFVYRSEQHEPSDSDAHHTTAPPPPQPQPQSQPQEQTHKQKSEPQPQPQHQPQEQTHKQESEPQPQTQTQPQEQTHKQKSEWVEESHVTRSTSDTSVQAPTKKVLKKSASEKVYVADPEKEEEVDQRRPATVKETAPTNWAGDEAVDAKADDFIDRFRKQLKLQRLVQRNGQ